MVAPPSSFKSIIWQASCFVLLVSAFASAGQALQSGQSSAAELAASQVLNDPFESGAFPNDAHADTDALFPMAKCQGLTIEDATIDQLQEWLTQKKLTSLQLAMCYLQRQYQTQNYINAILEINPDWMVIAQQLDEERECGTVRGPLHGIPFLVKDNIASKDKMETTAGCFNLLGSIVPRDAHVVLKLREAGALLMGKAALSEWADMRSNNYSEGFSGRGGQARSPYNFSVNPGGSSTGSATSVSANLIAFALGTETDGSVINPAERNAIVGIKPTVGLTSRAGVIPESTHQDTVGAFGRTVRDATLALDAIYGPDARDNYTSAQVGRTPKGGYLQYVTDRSALKGAVFGLPWASFWAQNDPAQNAQLLELLRIIEEAGATIINGTQIPNYQTTVSQEGWNWDLGSTRGFPNQSEYTYVKVDFYNNIKSYLSELTNTNIRGLEDIVQYNIDNVGSEGGTPGIHPAFGSGQDGFLASLATKGEMNPTYYEALAFCHHASREDGIDAGLHSVRGRKLDGLLVPPDVGPSYQLAAQAGYPVITVPAGVNEVSHMPYGLAIMNTAWSEGTLIKYASAIEDLQLHTNTPYKRTKAKWYGYLDRIVPILNA